MNRTQILFLFIFPFLIACTKDADTDIDPIIETSESRPNILLIIGDDIGVDATVGYEAGKIKPLMPNLQKLASDGLTFDNMWAYPVCSPTRASILTGRYGYRTGVLNPLDASMIPAEENTIQAYLDEKLDGAYAHALIGKWHLSRNNEPNRPNEMGIDYFAGLLGGGVDDYNNWSLTENGSTSNYSGYITTKITDLSIEWIAQQEDPWFCWVAYTASHTPLHLPPTEMHSQGALATDQASIDADPIPYFMAMTESIDFELGRLLANIPAEELDSTIVIFIGDNGTSANVIQSPFERKQGRGSLYQGGINVPMIISGAGVSRKNERDNHLVSSVDLFATIAEIAGHSVSNYEDSQSFKDLLTTNATGARLYNYSEVLNELPIKSGYTIRSDRYKLIILENGDQLLFDLQEDPFEKTNLDLSKLTSEQLNSYNLLISEASKIRS